MNANILKHLGIDVKDAARWCSELNCWKWPNDFPIPMPEGWDKLNDREKYKNFLFQMCSSGIRALTPEEEQNLDWHVRVLGHTEKLYEQWLLHQNDREWCIRNYYGYSQDQQEEMIACLQKEGLLPPPIPTA